MKKFLILLLALMLPLCASAAITVPDHVTEIGAEAFAGVNTDYLVVPATVKTVGTNVLGGSSASYLWLEGAATKVNGDPGVPFIFGPADSAAAGMSGFYAKESLVTNKGLYYAVLEDRALPLCAVNPSTLSGTVTIPKTLRGLPVTSTEQLDLRNTNVTEVHIPRYLTSPAGTTSITYATMSVDTPVASVTETPSGKYVNWSTAGYSGNYGTVHFIWTFENGGKTATTTTTDPFVKYAPLNEGTCTATVRVVDEAGDWAEATSDAITVTKGTTTYRALLIGNNYPGASNELKGPENDIVAMRTMLSSMSGTPYMISSATNLTASGIQSTIATTFSGAEPGDVSLFYFSGHGTDAGALVGANNTFLSVYGLRSALERIPGIKIVLLDCCHSGTAINRATGEETVNLNAFNRAIISGLTSQSRSAENLEDEGFIVMTACRKDQQSISLTSGSNYFWGVFTYGVCYGSGYDEWNRVSLGKLPADKNGDGAITLGEAYQGVLERVSYLNTFLIVEQATQYHGDQSFVLWSK